MRILLAITGASGVIYGKRLLEVLNDKENAQVELIVSEAGRKLLDKELDIGYNDLKREADEVYSPDNLEAPPSSGSSQYDCMVILPCSMSSLSKIGSGISDNLITRAALVFLKENRDLVLAPRETPLTTKWLDKMKELSEEGAIILPAMPAYYHNPRSIDDLVEFIVGKVLDSLDIQNRLFERWDDIE